MNIVFWCGNRALQHLNEAFHGYYIIIEINIVYGWMSADEYKY